MSQPIWKFEDGPKLKFHSGPHGESCRKNLTKTAVRHTKAPFFSFELFEMKRMSLRFDGWHLHETAQALEHSSNGLLDSYELSWLSHTAPHWCYSRYNRTAPDDFTMVVHRLH